MYINDLTHFDLRIMQKYVFILIDKEMLLFF